MASSFLGIPRDVWFHCILCHLDQDVVALVLPRVNGFFRQNVLAMKTFAGLAPPEDVSQIPHITLRILTRCLKKAPSDFAAHFCWALNHDVKVWDEGKFFTLGHLTVASDCRARWVRPLKGTKHFVVLKWSLTQSFMSKPMPPPRRPVNLTPELEAFYVKFGRLPKKDLQKTTSFVPSDSPEAWKNPTFRLHSCTLDVHDPTLEGGTHRYYSDNPAIKEACVKYEFDLDIANILNQLLCLYMKP